jgi:hypothetical protein
MDVREVAAAAAGNPYFLSDCIIALKDKNGSSPFPSLDRAHQSRSPRPHHNQIWGQTTHSPIFLLKAATRNPFKFIIVMAPASF